MPPKKNHDAVIALCIQEPTEEGSSLDFGAIQGDDAKFLHQAFIFDTINNMLDVKGADLRLYATDIPERQHLVKIVTEYLKKKATGDRAKDLETRFSIHEQSHDRWGVRVQELFQDCFKAGYKNVLVIGSHTPTIRGGMLKHALDVLKKADAVFGPTPEGRYYVVGLTDSVDIDLSEFDWTAPTIYSDVSKALDDRDLKWSELEIWYCVESPDELELMARDINQYRFEGDETTARETEVAMERLLNKLEL